MKLRRRTAIYTRVPIPLDGEASWSPPKSPSSSSPPPPKIMDEVAVRPLRRRGKLASSPSRMPATSTISIYELLQIARFSTVSVLSPIVPRRNSWEAGEPIPGLGVHVSVVGVKFPPNARPLRRDSSTCARLSTTPGSAFSPVTTSSPVKTPPTHRHPWYWS